MARVEKKMTLFLALACLMLVLGRTSACPTTKFSVKYMTKCCDYAYHTGFLGYCCKSTVAPNGCYCLNGLTPNKFLDPVACVPDVPTTTTTTTTTTTSPTTTTTYLPETARCPKPVPRLLGGFELTDPCYDPGVIGFAALIPTELETSKMCNGIFVFDQAQSKRAIRLSQSCYDIIKSLVFSPLSLEARIVHNTFNVTNTTFENTDFADNNPVAVNGVVTLIPTVDTERVINNYTSSCYSIACERNPTNVTITEIDFNNCTVYSYGSTNINDTSREQLLRADYTAVDVHVERYNGWDQDYPCQPILDFLTSDAYTKPNNNSVCFVAKDGKDATCHITDRSAPLMCWTKDGVDELLMGFTAPYHDCSNPIDAFVVFPY